MNSQPDSHRWPPQIKYIVGNEAAERFSFYGMKSILALYITSALAQSKDRATTIIHLFVFAVYFVPLLGAYVSDRLWGRYKTILYISLFYCLGHGVLATSDLFHSVDAKLMCLYTGLTLIAFGSGGIKPCVSAFMGDQFASTEGTLIRKAYSAFYFSINFGSFFSFLIIPWIAAAPTELVEGANWIARLSWKMKQAGLNGYGWAFGVPGILMAFATFIFWLGTKHYVRKAPARETRTAGFFTVFMAAFRSLGGSNGELKLLSFGSLLTSVILPLVAMVGMVIVALHHHMTPLARGIGWLSVVCLGLWYLLLLGMSLFNRSELPDEFWRGAARTHSAEEISAARSVAPILSVFAFVVPFWALFDQSSSTWVLQGALMKPFKLLGLQVGAEQMQSLNPALVMLLVPLLTLGIYPLCEKLGLAVKPLRRIAAGLLLSGFSFVIVAWLQKQLEAGRELSLAWQCIPYVILTIGEVLTSTTGLEFAYTQAGAAMKSTVMSFWLLTVAMGNLVVTTVTQLGGGHGDESVSSGRFMLFAGMMITAGVLFVLVAVRYTYREDVAQAR